MDNTPKASRSRGKLSITLNKRLSKRLASPQNHAQTTEKSSLSTLFKDVCTPPQKKLNLDNSFLDDSPVSYEDSHSPTSFLSQTFCPDSPEVGWQWTLDDHTKIERAKQRNDNSTNNNQKHVRCTRSETLRKAYLNKREEKRQARIKEIRKAEKLRTEAVLQERLTRLSTRNLSVEIKEFKKDISTNNTAPAIDSILSQTETTQANVLNLDTDFNNIFDDSMNLEQLIPDIPDTKEVVEPVDDFFNDSDTDSLLIAATQTIETNVPKITQKLYPTTMPPEINTHTEPKNIIPISETCKEHRSSLYMKFLEEDDDDLFDTLDEAWLTKASDSPNTRSPFQRYKSMPATTTKATSTTSKTVNAICSSNSINPEKTIPAHNIKRHASSHAISSPNLRRRQLHRRD